MKEKSNIEDLYVEQGRDVQEACQMIWEELPDIKHKVSDQHLRNVLDQEIMEAKSLGKLLNRTFKTHSKRGTGKKAHCFKTVFSDIRENLNRRMAPEIRDAMIINAVQRLNFYKITGLALLSRYARKMGDLDLVMSLRPALDAEKGIDKELTVMARNNLNSLSPA